MNWPACGTRSDGGTVFLLQVPRSGDSGATVNAPSFRLAQDGLQYCQLVGSCVFFWWGACNGQHVGPGVMAGQLLIVTALKISLAHVLTVRYAVGTSVLWVGCMRWPVCGTSSDAGTIAKAPWGPKKRLLI
jgi:hypothetical protein